MKDALRLNDAHPNPTAARIMVTIRKWTSELCAAPANPLQLTVRALFLLALVLLVYRPILPGNFLMDDWRLIESDNGLSNGTFTPFNQWFQFDFTLSYFALWLQWHAWGTHPGWYHGVNLLLHASSAILVWRLLASLKIPGAWLAAALYAVHPVCVNSVARIAEIKNTLSLPFFLFSFWAYLHYEKQALYPDSTNSAPPRGRATIWYMSALVAFILALLSKTSTVMLPLVLLACAAWQRCRLGRKDVWHTIPFFILAGAFGLMSIWFQKNQALFSAGETLEPETWGERIPIAGHVFSFYLGKALLPFNLNLVYPQWPAGSAMIASYLPYLFFAAALLWCWRFPFARVRNVLFGLGCFAVTLFPAMGFFDSQFLTRWQVSDHLQYLPLIAPVALLAAGLGAFLDKISFRAVSLVLILIFSGLTFQRAAVYSSEEKLFKDSIAKNPAASVPHNDLGITYAKKQDYAAAQNCFEAAIQADPKNADAHSNLGHLLMLNENLPAAEAQYQAALKLKPFHVDAHKNFAQLLQHEGRNAEAIYHYQVALCFKPDFETRYNLASLFYQTGQPRPAIAQYKKMLIAKPDDVETLNNLAWLLATSGNESDRNGAEAVRCAEKACALTAYSQARFTGTLAAAYAEANRFPDAVTTGQTTVKLANAAGDQSITYVGNQLLILYRNNQPYHEPLAVAPAP